MFQKAFRRLGANLKKFSPFLASSVSISIEHPPHHEIHLKPEVIKEQDHFNQVKHKKEFKQQILSAIISSLFNVFFNLAIYFGLFWCFGQNLDVDISAFLFYPCIDMILLEIDRWRAILYQDVQRLTWRYIFTNYFMILWQVDATLYTFGLLDLFKEQWGSNLFPFLGFSLESPFAYTDYVKFREYFTYIMWADYIIMALHGEPAPSIDGAIKIEEVKLEIDLKHKLHQDLPSKSDNAV